MPRSSLALTVTSGLLLALTGGPAAAQTSAVIDEGTFMVTRSGTALGRESFRIVRAPGPNGQVYRATGQSALGDHRFTTSLGTDSLGVPVAYESELGRRGEVVQRLQGRGRPGRFSIIVWTKSGEAAREYLLNNGALLIDDEVIHQFYFIPVAAARGELTVIVPRAAQQGRYRVEERPTDTVEIAGRAVASRRFALVPASGSSRDVWTDMNGRLLKVSIPEKGITALRDDLPRQ
jgi:hypothetical protein